MSTALFEAHVTQLDAEAENIAAAFGGVPFRSRSRTGKR